MLLGAVLPALLFAPQPSEGGTHVPFSPLFHYLDKVFLPALSKLGGAVELELVRWGFYPKGGGEIRAHVKPCRGLQGSEGFYGEIGWNYRWMHDRAWQENSIFGKVRYMSYAGSARRFDVKINIATWLGE